MTAAFSYVFEKTFKKAPYPLRFCDKWGVTIVLLKIHIEAIKSCSFPFWA